MQFGRRYLAAFSRNTNRENRSLGDGFRGIMIKALSGQISEQNTQKA